MEAMLLLNGRLVYNYPIWMVRHNEKMCQYGQALVMVYKTNTSDGQLDLSNFYHKFHEFFGKYDARYVNLNNRDFVEFVLFGLGIKSRERMLWVHTLILSDNDIESIDMWGPFFHFVPNLRNIIIKNTKLKQHPIITEWPLLKIESDFGVSFNGELQADNDSYSRTDRKSRR